MKPRSWKLFLTFFISYTSHGALPAKKISNETTRAYKSNEPTFISKKNRQVCLNCQKRFRLLLDMQSLQNIHQSMQKNQTKILVFFIWCYMLYCIHKNYFYFHVNFLRSGGSLYYPTDSSPHIHIQCTVALTYSTYQTLWLYIDMSWKKQIRKRVDSTRTSPVVTHPSTTRAWGCLTSQSERDMVFSA